MGSTARYLVHHERDAELIEQVGWYLQAEGLELLPSPSPYLEPGDFYLSTFPV